MLQESAKELDCRMEMALEKMLEERMTKNKNVIAITSSDTQ